MAFGHPAQSQHMLTGIKKAIASPRTPPHLKVHLQNRLQGANMAFGKPFSKKPAAMAPMEPDEDDMPMAGAPTLGVKPKRSMVALKAPVMKAKKKMSGKLTKRNPFMGQF